MNTSLFRDLSTLAHGLPFAGAALLASLLLATTTSAQDGHAAHAVAAARATPDDAMPKPQRILILGGTGFLGPQIVDAATARGHHVTLFNRGKTRPELFKDRPEIEILHGDRDPKKDEGLASLEDAVVAGTHWDAVVDTSGYVPRIVGASANVLAPAIDQYVFISTISVFADDVAQHSAEDGKLATMPDETSEDVRQFYGALKVLCEKAAEAAAPGKVTTIRPGLIVGPGDPTDRFTYWPVRIARGGEVLCPGDGADPIQFIDVRDLAEFTVHCIEQRSFGTFNATGPERELPMKELVDACAAQPQAPGATPATLTWVPTDFLVAQQVSPWSDMPVWVPRGPDNGFSNIDCSKAIAAGLSFRPVTPTVHDTLAWWATLPEERRAKLKDGISPEREAEVLAAWKASEAAPR